MRYGTVSFVMSLRPHGTTQLHKKNFIIITIRVSSKNLSENSIALKILQEKPEYVFRDMRIYKNILSISSQN